MRTPLKLASRLALLGRFRQRLVAAREELLTLLQALRPQAGKAELISSELIPLLDNLRYLESHTEQLLAPRKLGGRGRPAWLFGVDSVVYREPLGRVLMVAPSNYPLFLPMVSAVSAWAAGNSVWMKPAPGSSELHSRVQDLFFSVGGRPQDFVLLGEQPEEVERALKEGVQKLVLVGSADTGEKVLARAGAALVPAVAELSGWDCIFVHPQADPDEVARHLAWSLALNGGRTCVAPRRVFVRGAVEPLEAALSEQLALRPKVELGEKECSMLSGHKGPILGSGPAVLSRVGESHPLLREAHFGGLAVLHVVESDEDALRLARNCPYALGAALFGPPDWAQEMSHKVPAQVVCLNDLIVPTADPRVPFGGSGRSGWGRIRGEQGLLEMTQTRTVCTRRGGSQDHLLPPSPNDDTILEQFLLISHGGSLVQRLKAVARLVTTIARERIRRRREGKPRL